MDKNYYINSMVRHDQAMLNELRFTIVAICIIVSTVCIVVIVDILFIDNI